MIHIDTSKDADKIKSVCGIKPDGEQKFIYVYPSDKIPSEIDCPECLKKYNEMFIMEPE